MKVGRIVRSDPLFPSQLLAVEPIIEVLYFRGKWNRNLFSTCVAVVGTRRITQYGRRVVSMMVPELVAQGQTIVSGLMYGVDRAAHEETVACGGKTIAVLGWGVEWQSEETRELEARMLEGGGLILSEYEGDRRAQTWTFPRRNRIVAGLADTIYIVEAAEKSGSLNTARWGQKLGKTMYAVPGPVTSLQSVGTNWLIGQGLAKAWKAGSQEARSARREELGQKNEAKVMEVLEQGETLTTNEIARRTGVKVGEAAALLSMLSMQGVVVEQGGAYYLAR